MVQRFWVSWWSTYEAEAGCTRPPYQLWITGYRASKGDLNYDECSICAVIDAESEADIWASVARYFSDYEPRFCNVKVSDWRPGDRFPGFLGETSLLEAKP